jgi:hypothetical protein
MAPPQNLSENAAIASTFLVATPNFCGNSETLGDFINKIEGLLDTFPTEDHLFILKIVIHQKLSDSVKCNLPPTIQTWPALKQLLLNQYGEVTNSAQYYNEIFRIEVHQFDSIDLYLENLQKTFDKYKKALQYSGAASITDTENQNFVAILVEKISRYVEPYVLSLASNTTKLTDAVQSKIPKKKNSVDTGKDSNISETMSSLLEIKRLQLQLNRFKKSR